MTSLPLSIKLRKLIAKEMAEGKYDSEEETVMEALTALAERRRSIEAISRGLEDVKAGRLRSWRECKQELLKRKPHLADK